MVTRRGESHSAFGVADEERGLTAKTPKRQKRERDKIGVSRGTAETEFARRVQLLHRRPVLAFMVRFRNCAERAQDLGGETPFQ